MAILNFVGWETGYQSTTLGGMGEGNAAGTISLSSAITEKTIPLGADMGVIEDSATTITRVTLALKVTKT